MKKRVLAFSLILIVIIPFFNFPFSVSAENEILDNLEVNEVPVPEIPTDGLLNDELSTEINEDYFNSDHFAYGEEDTTIFDSGQDFVQSEQLPSSDLHDLNVQDDQNTVFNDSTRSVAVSDNNDGIMPLADDSELLYEYHKSWNFRISIKDYLPLDNPQFIINDFLGAEIDGTYDCTYSAYQHLIDYYIYGDYPSYDDLLNSDFLTVDNCIIFKYDTYAHGTKYGFLFTDNGRFDMVSYDNDLGSTNLRPDASQIVNFQNLLFSWSYGKRTDNNGLVAYKYDDVYCVINGVGDTLSIPSGGGSIVETGFETNFTPVYIGSNIDLYIDDVKHDKLNEDGFIDGDIKGEFKFNEKSHILSYKSWSENELDKTYDVHLWALDSSDVPTKINGSESFPIVDLDIYTENNLQLSADKTSVQASIDLESVYYYVHQMKGFDDSLESVSGYNFTEFERREDINFAIAYREHGRSGDWIVCKSYHYNYGDLIDNVMGVFTVKKDYVDFPPIDDYIESMPDFDDYLAEIGGDDPGIIDYVKAGFKYIGGCIGVFCHNFVGFFKWLWDCIPILWENLTIALYNLVCDIKELAIYLFKPKIKSIYQMATERIPSFNLFINSFGKNSVADLPSFTLFGTKFSLNLADYDINFSFFRSISTVIFYVLFGYFIFKLLFKIFGFGSSGDSGGDDD